MNYKLSVASVVIAFFLQHMSIAQSQIDTLKIKRQVDKLEREKSLRSDDENKLHSDLFHLLKLSEEADTSAYVKEKLSAKLKIHKELRADSENRIAIYINLYSTSDSKEVADIVKSLNGEVELVSDFPFIRCRIHPKKLRDLMKIKSIKNIERASLIKPNSNISIGYEQLKADSAFYVYGVNGFGKKIGVINMGIAHLANLPKPDELPSDISNNILETGSTSGDHGTATLEVIYDLAPGAVLYYYGIYGKYQEMAQAIRTLSNAGCKIIIDNIHPPEEPYFTDEDTSLGKAIRDFNFIGGTLISAAGNYNYNYNTQDGRTVFSGKTNASAYAYHIFPDGKDYIEWAPTLLFPYGQIFLQWATSWNSPSSDYDLLVFDSNDSLLNQNNNGTLRQNSSTPPSEIVWIENPSGTYRVRIKHCFGDAASTEFKLFTQATSGLRNSYTDNKSIFGHAAYPNVISVAAYQSDYPNDISGYSSWGPSKMYSFTNSTWFENKTPTITATSKVNTYGGQNGLWDDPFSGTSAAAPHIAAIAGLYFEKYPSNKREDFINDLTQSATSIDNGTGGVWNYKSGYGKANAVACIQHALHTVQTPTINPPSNAYQGDITITITSGTVGADIRYTIDGSEPDNASTLYSSSFIVTPPCTIKAKGFYFGMDPSPTQTNIYTKLITNEPSITIKSIKDTLISIGQSRVEATITYTNKLKWPNSPARANSFISVWIDGYFCESCSILPASEGEHRIYWSFGRGQHVVMLDQFEAPDLSFTYEMTFRRVVVFNITDSLLVLLDQKTEEGEHIGTMAIWNGSSFDSRFSTPRLEYFKIGSNKVLHADTNIHQNKKYKNWNNSTDVINYHKFLVDTKTTTYFSYFLPTHRAAVQAKFDGANYGFVEFRDPWLIDYADPLYGYNMRNQGKDSARFRSIPSSDNNLGFETSYRGVFLNQTPDPQNPNRPYYSVRAQETQTDINGFTGYFLNWSYNSDSIALATPNNLVMDNGVTYYQTPVVFKQANATATALYKGHLISNSNTTTNGNGQQRIVSTKKYVGGNEVFEDVMVYESGGEIWVTTRTWGSATWSREIRLSDGLGGNSDPSIASRGLCRKGGLGSEYLFGDGIYVVWQKKNGDNTYDVYFAIRNSEEISGSFFLGWTSVCPVTGLRYKVNSTACTVPPKPVISIHQTLTDFSPMREYVPIVYRQNATTVNRQYTIIRSNSIFDGYFSPPSALSVTYPPENQTPGSQDASFCFSQPHITGDGINTLPLAYVDFDNTSNSYSLKTINCTNSGTQGYCVWNAPATIPASDGRALFNNPYSWIGNYVYTSSISHPQVIKRYGKECYAWLEVQSYENPFVPFVVYQERNADGSWNPNIYVWNLLDILNMNVFPSSVSLGIGPDYISDLSTSLLWSLNNTVYKTTKNEITGWQSSPLITNGYDAQTTYLGQYGENGGFTLPISLYTEHTPAYRKLKILDEEPVGQLIKPDGRHSGKITKIPGLPMEYLYTRTLTVKDTSQGTELSITVTQPRLGNRDLQFTSIEGTATGITAENCLELLSTLPATVSETDDTLSFGVQIRQKNFKSAIPALTCSFGNPGMLQKGASPASITMESNKEVSRHILAIPMKEYRGVSIKTMFGGIDFKALGNDLQFSLMHTYNLQKGDGIQSDQSTEKETVLPASISLLNNYPNPFNPSTSIKYEIPKSGQVTLKVFDVLGREVSTLVEGKVEAGFHTAIFDASNLASGIYFARLTVKSDFGEPVMITKKMLFTK